jgi:endonuclease YncB( thermonuclease family)
MKNRAVFAEKHPKSFLFAVFLLSFSVFLTIFLKNPANSAEFPKKTLDQVILDNQYAAYVLRVIDGDTLDVLVPVWPTHTLETKVRLARIDTPELFSGPNCARLLATQAKTLLADAVYQKWVMLTRLEADKYSGRVVSEVLAGSDNLSDMLLARNVARRYDGGKKQSDVWCVDP